MRDHDGEEVNARDHLHEADHREHPPARWTRREDLRAVGGGLRVDAYGYDREGRYYPQHDGWDGTR